MARYNRSLKKPPFDELAEKLGIDPSTLGSAPSSDGEPFMTHTAFWVHWPRFREAEPCPGMLRIEARRETTWEVVCDACGFEVVVPADGASRTNWLLARAELPPFAEKPFELTDESEPCRMTLRVWVAQPAGELMPGPAIHGKPGRGKTHLLALLGKQLVARHGVRVLFLTAPLFLSELQAAMGSPRYDELWQRAVRVEVLLLDDLGAEQATDWRADRVAALIDERYRAAKTLVVTTNVRPEDWEMAFDARTASRMRGMTFSVELEGPDWRGQAQREESSK